MDGTDMILVDVKEKKEKKEKKGEANRKTQEMDDLLRILDWCLPQWKLWNLGLLLLDGMEPNDATARFSWCILVSSPRFFALFSCLFWWTLVQNSEHRRNRQGPSSIRTHLK